MASGKSIELAGIVPQVVTLVSHPGSSRADRRKAGQRSNGRAERLRLQAVHAGRKNGTREALRAMNAQRLADHHSRITDGGDAA